MKQVKKPTYKKPTMTNVQLPIVHAGCDTGDSNIVDYCTVGNLNTGDTCGSGGAVTCTGGATV